MKKLKIVYKNKFSLWGGTISEQIPDDVKDVLNNVLYYNKNCGVHFYFKEQLCEVNNNLEPIRMCFIAQKINNFWIKFVEKLVEV